ncbi:hypothetical protein [Shimazuella alba]
MMEISCTTVYRYIHK